MPLINYENNHNNNNDTGYKQHQRWPQQLMPNGQTDGMDWGSMHIHPASNMAGGKAITHSHNRCLHTVVFYFISGKYLAFPEYIHIDV